MAKVEMSVHRALATLKTYKDRIEKSFQLPFITVKRGNETLIDGGTIEETKEQITGNLRSVNSLIENQQRLKAAIVKSNAETYVTFDGLEMSVAELIERKAQLPLVQQFLIALKKQRVQAVELVNGENEKLQSKLENYLQQVLGAKDKRTVEELEMHTKAFEMRHKVEFVDPCNLAKFIETYEEEITKFSTEVDYLLSESNALTKIIVDFVD